jgi:hypothetical protein
MQNATFWRTTALTIPTNVCQLDWQAASIVRGRVIAVQVEPHPELSNLTTVVVGLRVEENLKGTSELIMRCGFWMTRNASHVVRDAVIH